MYPRPDLFVNSSLLGALQTIRTTHFGQHLENIYALAVLKRMNCGFSICRPLRGGHGFAIRGVDVLNEDDWIAKSPIDPLEIGKSSPRNKFVSKVLDRHP